jgi:hypothetical protein
MMEIKKVTPDRSKINLDDPTEARYWSKALGVDRDAIARAIDKVGNAAAAVRKELKLSPSAKDH